MLLNTYYILVVPQDTLCVKSFASYCSALIAITRFSNVLARINGLDKIMQEVQVLPTDGPQCKYLGSQLCLIPNHFVLKTRGKGMPNSCLQEKLM